jgi:signal transduction histidine kinase
MAKRTTLAVLSVLMFSVLTLGMPLLRWIESTESERVARSVDQDAWLLASALSPAIVNNNDAEVRRLTEQATKNQNLATLVELSNGTFLKAGGIPKQTDRERKDLAAALQRAMKREPYPARRSVASNRFLAVVPIVHEGRPIGALATSYLDETMVVNARRRRFGLLVVSLTGAALAILFAIALSRWITRPVRRLQLAARTFATGELRPSNEGDAGLSKGPREVKDLAETMELMAKQLDLTLARHRSFLANASHQLRSPLTAIALRLDNLRDRIGESPERDERDLSIMHSSLYDLSIQLDQLVRLAKTDHDSLEERVSIDAHELLVERKTLWEEEAALRKVALTVTPGLAVKIFATPGRIAQALDNLVTNAIDASTSGSTIELSATVKRTVSRLPDAARSGGRTSVAELRVIDHGEGMTEEKRERAFQLYATDKPNDRGFLGGSGLGLSLVQLLVLADRGSVVLEETSGGGTTALVTLPQPVSTKAEANR